jgi:hypothetical protein
MTKETPTVFFQTLQFYSYHIVICQHSRRNKEIIKEKTMRKDGYNSILAILANDYEVGL